LAQYALGLIVALVKPMLFVSKVPMVNGTIFSVAIVSFSIMVFSSGSSPSRTGEPEPLPLPPPSLYLAVPPRFTDEEKCQLPLRLRIR